MIEPNTIIRWAHELVAFVNGPQANAPVAEMYTAEDADQAPAEYRLPEEVRSEDQVTALRKRARACLTRLAKWQPSKEPEAPMKLVRMAEEWLDDDLVRSTNRSFNFTPMDGVLSLSEEGRLQVVPRFRSLDAQYAVTFAELIQEDSPAMIKRCDTCQNFFVRLRGARGQPRKLCDEHYEQSKQTRKKTK
jgi:hypothetical protein